MLFQILHECGQVRQAIGHHCVWPSEPEAPSNGSWILLVEDQVTVATANEELLVILFSYFDGVVEPFIVDAWTTHTYDVSIASKTRRHSVGC